MPFKKGYSGNPATQFKKGHRQSAEIRAKMSVAAKGKKRPWAGKYKRDPLKEVIRIEAVRKSLKRPEVRKKISEALKGEKNYLWKGDNVGYVALHDWVNKWLGKPNKCEFCKTEGLTGRHINWANKSREYKRDLEDWLRLCVPCHREYDGGQAWNKS